jgi:hypothetical protein
MGLGGVRWKLCVVCSSIGTSNLPPLAHLRFYGTYYFAY